MDHAGPFDREHRESRNRRRGRNRLGGNEQRAVELRQHHARRSPEIELGVYTKDEEPVAYDYATIEMPFNKQAVSKTLLENTQLLASLDGGKTLMTLDNVNKLLGSKITIGAYTVTPNTTPTPASRPRLRTKPRSANSSCASTTRNSFTTRNSLRWTSVQQAFPAT
ncbi:MAG: hypothetical protein V8Q29_03000 [Alistipes shahii]